MSIAKFPRDERTAFCRIVFSDNLVKKWVVTGGNPENKSKDNFDSCKGFSVDAGIGIIVDEKDRSAFNRIYNEKTLKKGSGTWKYNVYEFAKDKTLAIFSTGYGDGYYCVYIGYDKYNKICKLLIDFNVVNW